MDGKISASIRAGQRFEEQVFAYLHERFPVAFRSGVWISYALQDGRSRRCQLDGLLLHENALWIIECKLRHIPGAWEQMLFYKTLISHLYPAHSVGVLEICKIFDPDTWTPAPVHLQWTLEPHLWHSTEFNVLILSEKLFAPHIIGSSPDRLIVDDLHDF